MNKLIVFTDGSCINNGKPNCKAGYGIHFPNKEFKHVSKALKSSDESGKCPSNNRAELTAILTTLKILKNIKNTEINIYSDSKYCINSLTVWYKSWIANKWKGSNNKPVLNSDIIKDILLLSYLIMQNGNNIIFHYVQAHTKKDDFESKCNDIVDKLAKDSYK